MKPNELNTGEKLRKQTPLKWFYALPTLVLLWLGFYLGGIIPQCEWWVVPFWITFAITCVASLAFFVNNITNYPMD